MAELNSKPCLVQTAQGFSVTYKEKLLYSKYNPQKNILSIIENTTILPGTIILCLSPVLEYGLEELYKKCPKNCIAFGIEKDADLYELSKNSNSDKAYAKSGFFNLVQPENVNTLPSLFEKLCQKGEYRRVISMDFSGGAQFYRDFYNELFIALQNTVNQFWKNRVTLVRFGRKYSSNILKNLKYFPKSIRDLKTDKAIIVAGAGESAINTLKSIKADREKYFIIAVDVLLKTLKALDMKADAVICEEAQNIIVKAFTGCKKQFDYLFLSSTVNPICSRIAPEKNIFYTPLFANLVFLERLTNYGIVTGTQAPLGSVGLSAVETALKIRKSEDIPVFVTGLDFSYSKGKTHAVNSLHDFIRRKKSNYLCGAPENWGASFENSTTKTRGKDGKEVFTTAILNSYAELFNFRFAGIKNLFDAGSTGLKLDIPPKLPCSNYGSSIEIEKFSEDYEQKINSFISEEIKALNELKTLFTTKTTLSQEEKNKKIQSLLEEREYLYLHFPDGTKASLSQDFLNRVRTELDYFLKKLR